MVIALGFWTVAVGYALVYTGVQWFTGSGTNSSLAQNIGLKTALTPAPGKTTAAVTGGGPSGTGYPSSTQV